MQVVAAEERAHTASRAKDDCDALLQRTVQSHEANTKQAVRQAEASASGTIAELETAMRSGNAALNASEVRLKQTTEQLNAVKSELEQKDRALADAQAASEELRATLDQRTVSHSHDQTLLHDLEQARGELETCRRDLASSKLQVQCCADQEEERERSFGAAVDEVRRHADTVIAAREKDAEDRCSAALKQQVDAKKATELAQALLLTEQGIVKVLTVKGEAASREIDHLQQYQQQARADVTQMQTKHSQDLEAAYAQLGSQRTELTGQIMALREEADRRMSAWSDERAALDSTIAGLQTSVAANKRELHRHDEISSESKRLRRALHDSRMDSAKMTAAHGAMKDQLQEQRTAMSREQRRLQEAEAKRCEAERDLAVAEFKAGILGGTLNPSS